MVSDSLKFKVFCEPQAFCSLTSEWDSLCDALEAEVTVFSSCVWYQNWWKYFSAGAKLHLFTMWQGDKLVGIAPLMWVKSSFHGLPVRTVGFIQDKNNHSLHNDFIVLPEFKALFLKAMVRSLFESSSLWDLIYFRNISIESANFKTLADILDEDDRSWKQKPTPFDSPFIRPAGSWDEYFAKRSRLTRKKLKNLQNKVSRCGEIAVKNIRTWDEFLLCKEELFKVAQRSWSENVNNSIASPANRGFMESLSSHAAEKGWLSIWALYLDGKMIALEYHLRAYGREHALRGHYRQELAALSPGTFLEMAILENVFERSEKVNVYDFCGCFDDYKKKWTDSYVSHCDVFVFNKNMYSKYIELVEFKLISLLKKMLQLFTR